MCFTLTEVEWIVPRLLLWGILWAELLRLRECERRAVWGRTNDVGVAKAPAWADATAVLPIWGILLFEVLLLSVLGDCPLNEEMERGQETERRMSPDSAGEETEPNFSGLGEGFQCTRPEKEHKTKLFYISNVVVFL